MCLCELFTFFSGTSLAFCLPCPTLCIGICCAVAPHCGLLPELEDQDIEDDHLLANVTIRPKKSPLPTALSIIRNSPRPTISRLTPDMRIPGNKERSSFRSPQATYKVPDSPEHAVISPISSSIKSKVAAVNAFQSPVKRPSRPTVRGLGRPRRLSGAGSMSAGVRSKVAAVNAFSRSTSRSPSDRHRGCYPNFPSGIKSKVAAVNAFKYSPRSRTRPNSRHSLATKSGVKSKVRAVNAFMGSSRSPTPRQYSTDNTSPVHANIKMSGIKTKVAAVNAFKSSPRTPRSGDGWGKLREAVGTKTPPTAYNKSRITTKVSAVNAFKGSRTLSSASSYYDDEPRSGSGWGKLREAVGAKTPPTPNTFNKSRITSKTSAISAFHNSRRQPRRAYNKSRMTTKVAAVSAFNRTRR